MKSYMYLVGKGKSAAEIIKGAGKTDMSWNVGVIGGGTAVAAVKTASTASNCGCP